MSVYTDELILVF